MKPEPISISIDTLADAAYIHLSDNKAVKTKEITDDVIVDLDRFNKVVGIELLAVDADLPYSSLENDFGIEKIIIEQIKILQTNRNTNFQVA